MKLRTSFFCLVLLYLAVTLRADEQRPNFLIITVDDMSCDSVGAFGCQLTGTTPHIDRLAKLGLRYDHAHVQTGSCYPSRNVMWSGRYSHNTGVEGFYQVKNTKYPHLVDLMKDANYFVAIRGKVSHSTPYQPYGWDADLTVLDGQRQHIKDPKSYFRSTARGIELAQEKQQSFCLNINISDPHKPFYGVTGRGKKIDDPFVPTRIFSSSEVPVPGFLFDHPDIREELALYYSSVRRADDCVGQVLRALDESGQADNTVVIFLSDHGMPLPFAKTGVWHHSTRTPLIVRWPGKAKAGTVDRKHMVSAVDLLPTLLAIAERKIPERLDGRSFLPTIFGLQQSTRDFVYKFHNENSGRNRSPMRVIQTKKFGYHFNPWSDGNRVFSTATRGTASFRTMQKLAPSKPKIAARLDLFEHGIPEEFYDYEKDPNALNNLINDPDYADEIDRHRQLMEEEMRRTRDPLLKVFLRRDDAEFVSDCIDELQAEANKRRKESRKKRPRSGKQGNPRLFQLKVESAVGPKDKLRVVVKHSLPEKLRQQKFHVTLKDAAGKRVQRIVKSAAGNGELKFEFPLTDVNSKSVNVAAFVGEDFQQNLMFRKAGPIKLQR